MLVNDPPIEMEEKYECLRPHILFKRRSKRMFSVINNIFNKGNIYVLNSNS